MKYKFKIGKDKKPIRPKIGDSIYREPDTVLDPNE